jgi:hypothetical protein
MAGRILAAMLAACVAGCGGGGGSSDPAPAPPPVKATSLVAIGNSLTFIPDQADWSPGRGAAASDLAHDYVHVAASGMGLTVSAQRNFARAERPANDPNNTPADMAPMAQQIASQTAGIDASTDVVVLLGDNAWTGPSPEYDQFVANYAALLAAIEAEHPHALYCLSTWWINTAKDAMISAACTAHGGRYVFIGDIYPTRQDVIPASEDPNLLGHPHDWSMAAIAQRIIAAQ